MTLPISLRRRMIVALASVTAGLLTVTATTLAPSPAFAQSTEDFHVALETYGFWQPHPRWGEVWIPFGKPRTWRPYTVGRWIYTDEWGWYWDSAGDEQPWGWIAFHYGRWVLDAKFGWAWTPGDEWAPAWVNWRRSDDVLGWAPAPPEQAIYDYDDDPAYWTFVEPRYLAGPLTPRNFMPAARVGALMKQTILVNRAFVSGSGARFAVNPGINPGFVAARAGRPLETFRVRPRVLAGTRGVAGGQSIRAAQNKGVRVGAVNGQLGTVRAPALPAVSIQRAATVAPAAVQPPQALGRERGRLGNHPPRAAQGGGQGAAPSALESPPPDSTTSAPSASPTAIAPPQRIDRSRPFGPAGRANAGAPPAPSSPAPAQTSAPPPAVVPPPSSPPAQQATPPASPASSAPAARETPASAPARAATRPEPRPARTAAPRPAGARPDVSRPALQPRSNPPQRQPAPPAMRPQIQRQAPHASPVRREAPAVRSAPAVQRSAPPAARPSARPAPPAARPAPQQRPAAARTAPNARAKKPDQR